MNDWKLPEDLQRLEDELKALPRPALPLSLRTGVDRDTCIRPRDDSRRRWYAFAACAAASALLWVNFSFRAAIATDFHLAGQPHHSSTIQLEEQLRDLLPDLDAQEVRQQTMVLRARSRIAPHLVSPGSTTRLNHLNGIDQLL